MRIVYFGTPELAVPTLDTLHRHHEVAAVVCQPDRPQGRSGKPAPPPTKVWALEHNVLVNQPTKLNDGSFETWLQKQRPDLCVLVAYGRILKEPILDTPQHGFLNLHPSLLPKYRGPSPIQSVLLHGEEKTGLTVMRINMDVDAGDILLQEEADIMPEDTTATLSARLARLGADLMLRGVGMMEDGTAEFSPQDDAMATYTRTLEKNDGAIDWNWPAGRIHNLVRAAVPWPVAQCRYSGVTVRILRTAVSDAPAVSDPGSVVDVGRDSITVATGDAHLEILELQFPGKRAMLATEFLRGHRIEPGERFDNG